MQFLQKWTLIHIIKVHEVAKCILAKNAYLLVRSTCKITTDSLDFA